MIINDWGGPDYKDIMAGVDHLIARGIADPDRLGVMGASYGGFMTNWIVTQTSRFKAASAGASIADLNDLYYLTDGGELMAEYFKRPWENPDGYREHSPLTLRRRRSRRRSSSSTAIAIRACRSPRRRSSIARWRRWARRSSSTSIHAAGTSSTSPCRSAP